MAGYLSLKKFPFGIEMEKLQKHHQKVLFHFFFELSEHPG